MAAELRGLLLEMGCTGCDNDFIDQRRRLRRPATPSSNWWDTAEKPHKGDCCLNLSVNQMMMMGLYDMKDLGKDNGLLGFGNGTKVWNGGLPENATSTDLNKTSTAHKARAGGTCLYAEVGMSDAGGAAFKTKEEQAQSIAMINGSYFSGNIIQVVCSPLVLWIEDELAVP